jgi:hypothetical protein
VVKRVHRSGPERDHTIASEASAGPALPSRPPVSLLLAALPRSLRQKVDDGAAVWACQSVCDMERVDGDSGVHVHVQANVVMGTRAPLG